MTLLSSYLSGSWQEGQGDPIDLHNPATEATVAQVPDADPARLEALAQEIAR